VRSQYASNIGARGSNCHIKATGTIDNRHKTPVRFGKIVEDLKAGDVGIRLQGRGCSSPRCSLMEFSKDELYDLTGGIGVVIDGLGGQFLLPLPRYERIGGQILYADRLFADLDNDTLLHGDLRGHCALTHFTRSPAQAAI
jgi:hypothetical protein